MTQPPPPRGPRPDRRQRLARSGTGIMPGTVIGRDSVVSFGAVVSGRHPQGVVLIGNPARVASKIPNVARAPID